MGSSTEIVFILLFSFLSQTEPHYLHRYCIARPGFPFILHLSLDDVTVYHFNSSVDKPVRPQWLDHSENGRMLWLDIVGQIQVVQYIVEKALDLAIAQFNHSNEDQIYECHSQIDLLSNGTLHSILRHGYGGKDLVSLDIETGTWAAAGLHAVYYQRIRADDIRGTNRLIWKYKTRYYDWIKQLLHFSAQIREPKEPLVYIFETKDSGPSGLDITCLVTGFYPRKVQVEWLGPEGLPLVEGVSSGEVLPNGDGSYQLRKRLNMSLGSHIPTALSCLVLHSSKNNTELWALKKSKEIQYSWSIISWICVVLVMIIFIGVVWFCCRTVPSEHQRAVVAQNEEHFEED